MRCLDLKTENDRGISLNYVNLLYFQKNKNVKRFLRQIKNDPH